MHDINDMLFFAHVVKVRSFSEAARRLDVSKSRVSKAIARLEGDLGVRLLHRSTRSLSLTDVGEAYFEHCDRILEELSLADTTISRLHQEPRGKLKISAPVAFSTMHVASALPDFMARYPDLTVDLTISDRLVDLADEGYDPVFGARPLKRLVQTTIEDGLAKRVLAGEVTDGDTVRFDVNADNSGLVVVED